MVNQYLETTEIVSINPLIPQSWGIFRAGGHPQTPGQEVSFTSFSAVSFNRLCVILRERSEWASAQNDRVFFIDLQYKGHCEDPDVSGGRGNLRGDLSRYVKIVSVLRASQ